MNSLQKVSRLGFLGPLLGPLIFLVCTYSPHLMGQTDPKAVAVEAIKKLTAKIDQYVKNRYDPDQILVARCAAPDSWEWKRVKSEDEEGAFFNGFTNFRRATIWLTNSRPVFVRSAEWSESGDWYFSVDYYFDSQGSILQISSDFRTAVDNIKVLGYRYFDTSGQMLTEVIEYYALDPVENRRLPGKPETMQSFVLDAPIYLKAPDLPFYSLINLGDRKDIISKDPRK